MFAWLATSRSTFRYEILEGLVYLTSQNIGMPIWCIPTKLTSVGVLKALTALPLSQTLLWELSTKLLSTINPVILIKFCYNHLYSTKRLIKMTNFMAKQMCPFRKIWQKQVSYLIGTIACCVEAGTSTPHNFFWHHTCF